MYTCKYDKYNHTFTIMNTATKQGITMLRIGDSMALFLKKLVSQANLSSALVDELRKHRVASLISCEETCFCWEVEKVIDKDSEEAHV